MPRLNDVAFTPIEEIPTEPQVGEIWIYKAVGGWIPCIIVMNSESHYRLVSLRSGAIWDFDGTTPDKKIRLKKGSEVKLIVGRS